MARRESEPCPRTAADRGRREAKRRDLQRSFSLMLRSYGYKAAPPSDEIVFGSGDPRQNSSPLIFRIDAGHDRCMLELVVSRACAETENWILSRGAGVVVEQPTES
jgi:hypothetical protein